MQTKGIDIHICTCRKHAAGFATASQDGLLLLGIEASARFEVEQIFGGGGGGGGLFVEYSSK